MGFILNIYIYLTFIGKIMCFVKLSEICKKKKTWITLIPASDLFTTTIISTGTLFTVETFEAQTLCLGKVSLQINTKTCSSA